jgi:RHS repeat-associated protein
MLYWVDAASNATYRLADGLGSTVALANASGTVTDTYTYDVFGAVRSHTGTSGTEFTFTGEQTDPNGLEYLRARYYDPAVGRFLSRDPLGGGYPYAGGNPANMTDPTGLYEAC